jgi:polysaccharide biosynthesis/export protein
MKKHIVVLLAAVIIFLPSCVSNKRIAYLQYKNEFREPSSIVKDSLIRKYQTGRFAYLLQEGDLLDIKISTMTPAAFNPFNDADKNLVPGQLNMSQGNTGGYQTQGYYIDDKGELHLPIVGRMKVEGLTITQAEDSVAAYVTKYLQDPVVRIRLLNFRFSVVGEVDREVTLVSSDDYLTLLQALSMAGGASEFADLSRVKIIRRMGEETFVYYVNLLDEEFLSSPFYYVQPNDVIVATPLKQRSFLRYLNPNLSILTASVSMLVAIVTLLKIN